MITAIHSMPLQSFTHVQFKHKFNKTCPLKFSFHINGWRSLVYLEFPNARRLARRNVAPVALGDYGINMLYT